MEVLERMGFWVVKAVCMVEGICMYILDRCLLTAYEIVISWYSLGWISVCMESLRALFSSFVSWRSER